MINGKDLYFVAVKVFLENEKGEFLIIKDRFGCWDIPGGRLRPEDFNVSLDDVVDRKMKEELGSAVVYELGEPVVHMRHERNETLGEGETTPVRIFAVGYSASYISGDIEMGGNHEELEWVDPKEFEPEKYFTGGWLKGVEEYIEEKK
jgi:ADP-ribose pyrophosphatase YjhB (NUDIX family)